MSSKVTFSEEAYRYLLDHSLQESSSLKKLRQATEALPECEMMSAPDESQFLALLIQLMQARRVIEVGVFTGYTTLAMAQALPSDGYLLACDVSEEFTAVGQPFWAEAGVSSKIDLRIAPALNTLETVLNEGGAGQFDLIFIDADKHNYPHYFEYALRLVREGGLLAIDNTLGVTSARVFDREIPKRSLGVIEAIRKFNVSLYQDTRVKMSLLPVALGLTLAIKQTGMRV